MIICAPPQGACIRTRTCLHAHAVKRNVAKHTVDLARLCIVALVRKTGRKGAAKPHMLEETHVVAHSAIKGELICRKPLDAQFCL